MKKIIKIFILFEGYTGDDSGYPVAAFRTKKALREFVRTRYPKARGEERQTPSELYWQWNREGPHDAGGWLRADDEGITLQP